MANFTSADQTITAAGTLTIAHGLGAAPKFVKIFLVCQSADLGYSAGDVIEPILTSAGTNNSGCTLRVDATNIYVQFATGGAGVGTFWAIEKGGSSLDKRIADASWKLRIYADTTTGFTSTDQTITTSGSLSLAHGLGAAPKHVQFWLVCQTAELGYSAGAVVTPINSSDGTQNTGISVKATATNLNVTFPNSGTSGCFQVTSSTGATSYITNANWKLRVYCSLASGTNFTSTDQTITSAGTLTLAHGLGAAPKFVDMYLVCTSADRGFSIGDVIRPHETSAGLQNTGASFQVDGTNVVVRFANRGTSFGVFWAISAADNLDYQFDDTKWKLRVYAQR